MHGGEVLLLPNVWDVASARIIEEAGFARLQPPARGLRLRSVILTEQNISREADAEVIGRISRR